MALKSIIRSLYDEMVDLLKDIIPDFACDCYRVTGATSLYLRLYMVENIKVCYGTYLYKGTRIPHSWCKVNDCIIDFTHLQFEDFPGNFSSPTEYLYSSSTHPGQILFTKNMPEYDRYEEML